MEGRIAMSERDIDRLHVIGDVLEGRRRQVEAAALLRLSTRQVRRLCARVAKNGKRGILHALRGRPSNNRLDPELLGQALSALNHPLWEGFGPTFAAEKLQSRWAIKLGTETVRKLMTSGGLWRPRRHRARHRQWRERRPMLGMMVQLDGSDHDWFEGRGPRCVLLIYIDDATSQILYGEFVHVEDTLTLMRSTREYLRRRGRPLCFYVDKDSIYKTNRKAAVEEQFREDYPMTQFTRAMSELGIEVITANSPQAKGRVERGFDTHQDRLVKELRLRGISTMNEANKYLWSTYIPEHNERYAVAAAEPGDAHRPLLSTQDLDKILSLRIERSLALDFTVRFNSQFFQLLEEQPARLRPRDRLWVEVRLDGALRLLSISGKPLNFKGIPKRPERALGSLRQAWEAPSSRRRTRPPWHGPWKLYSYKRLGVPMAARAVA